VIIPIGTVDSEVKLSLHLAGTAKNPDFETKEYYMVENFKRKTVLMTAGTTIAGLNGENSNIGSTTLGWEW
jgi:hypothetical protein